MGKDSLSPADQLTLETAKMIREDFLQQNAFVDIDSFSDYDRQAQMLTMILDYDAQCRAAIEKGAAVSELFTIAAREEHRPGQERAGGPVRAGLRPASAQR